MKRSFYELLVRGLNYGESLVSCRIVLPVLVLETQEETPTGDYEVGVWVSEGVFDNCKQSFD